MYQNDKIQYLTDRNYIVIIGSDINIMPTEDYLCYPECAVMTMVSVSELNLFNDSPCMGIHDIVADRLPHSPLRRWTDNSTMTDI